MPRIILRTSVAVLAATAASLVFAQASQEIVRSGSYERVPLPDTGQKGNVEIKAELAAYQSSEPTAQKRRNRDIVRAVTGLPSNESERPAN
jgi:hypothetical protein